MRAESPLCFEMSRDPQPLTGDPTGTTHVSPLQSVNSEDLDRARQKVYWRLLPLLFLCYMVAYVDRSNVAIAKLTMSKDLPAFNNQVFGWAAGLFFWGYFLLEVPCS